MSSRLAFQTQLASIMEVLANAAVAEICKLVDDDYAVVSLQMSQCQRENKALKRKLHLLELKMARGTAERRLRESALNNGRLRVHISGVGNDRIREVSPSADCGFDQQTVSMWPDRALTASVPGQSDHPRSESPDVQLVEPEPVIVKEETETETETKPETKEEVHLIEDNGIMECSPHVPERPKHSFEISPSAPRTRTPPRAQRRSSATNRGVEEDGEPDVVLVKVEEAEMNHNQTGLIIQEVSSCQTKHTPGLEKQTGAMAQSLHPHCLVESSTDDIKASSTNQLNPSLPTISELDSRHHHTPLISSEFSLSELETFFTRWGPDTDSTAAPVGSFVNNVSAESEKDTVIIMENEQETTRAQTQAQTTMSQALSAPSSSSSIQSIHVQTSWMRTAAMLRNTQILNQNRVHSNVSITPATPLPAASSEPSSSLKIGLQHSTSSMPQGFLSSQMYKKPKKFTCKVCGKAFPGWSNLEAHERVHTGEKPFVCNTCGKRFSESGNLKKHQRVHTGEKPFSCEKCGKRFAWICNLRTHQQSATGCGDKGQALLSENIF